MDLRRLPKNQYLTSVDFDVSFAVPGGAARKETFTFTDAQVARLEAGPVHQRYFRHSQTAVAGVSGGVLRYLVGIEGALPKATRASLPPAAPFRPAGARVIGDVPAARAAGDGQFQDWLGTYDFYEDGLGPVTLRIGRSRRACARPAWCALVVTVTDLRGSEKRMRLDSVDPVRMVFFEDDVSRDARTRRPNWKRYEAYMLRRDKSKLVGIVQFEQAEERFGFYAERRD